jgi:hypothetical protein
LLVIIPFNVPPGGPVHRAQSRFNDLTFADLTRRGGKTLNRIQQMTVQSHPDPAVPTSDVGAAKLFTVGCGHEFAALALPPMNNFG